MKKYCLRHIAFGSTFFHQLVREAANQYVRAGAAGLNNGTDGTNAASAAGDFSPWRYLLHCRWSYGSRTFNTAVSGMMSSQSKRQLSPTMVMSAGWNDTFGDGQYCVWQVDIFSPPYWLIDGQTGGGPGSWKAGFGFKILSNATPLDRPSYQRLQIKSLFGTYRT